MGGVCRYTATVILHLGALNGKAEPDQRAGPVQGT